jgi:MoxR-like ATPase
VFTSIPVNTSAGDLRLRFTYNRQIAVSSSNEFHPKVANDVDSVHELQDAYNRIRGEIARVIVGQDEIIEQLLVTLLARGHCLLVGVPGLAKTLLIRTLAEVLDFSFSRIQFTPDLMPSDITGTEVIEENRSTGEKMFRFVRGPVFANIVLADEINRTPPKTQAALLESMQEHNVTAAGQTYRLPEPFFVLATQNPIEQEGTYPLPEAQLDRFMFNLWLDYPRFDEEVEIVKRTTAGVTPELRKVLQAEQIIAAQDLVRRVPVPDNVIEHAVRLVSHTRPGVNGSHKFVSDFISYGAGPRASQYLILGAKTRAILHGRYSPTVEDVRAVALPVLRHRIVTNFSAEAENVSTQQLVERLLAGA